jgi:hypothetical protein
MPVQSSVAGGLATHHGLAALSEAERHAAQQALAKLQQSGRGFDVHLRGNLESATVSSGLSHARGTVAAGLGTSTLIHGLGSDTFIGGVRGTPASHGVSIGNDTVLSGSAIRTGSQTLSESLAGRGVAHSHFALSGDTVSLAGATATSIQAGQHQHTTQGHTVTLADKTTITIAGLSAHDITKLHH